MEKEITDKQQVTIGLDFDGTCLTNENFPGIGKDVGAVPILKQLVENGNKLILWTIRDGRSLINAVKWFDENNIELSGINKLKSNSNSPKINADLFIDDKSLGIPLIKPDTGKPYVDWTKVRTLLKQRNIL